jgi:hypothetical protein
MNATQTNQEKSAIAVFSEGHLIGKQPWITLHGKIFAGR